MGWCVLFILVGVVVCVNSQNCRGEEPRERACENVCDQNGNCKIRAALLLPKNTTYDACLSVVEPVLELALQHDAVRDVLPSWLKFEWLTYDVTDCDAAYAVISAIDAYNDCAHVFFGPSCDYALASVARIAKFLGNTGTPIITTGGFTFDFVKPKQTCQDEFYMMVRAGPLGFKDLAYFLIDIMRHYAWRQLVLINEPDAQLEVAGKSTCHLMMKTFANFLKIEDIIYIPWDTTSDGGLNYTENLKLYVGFKYSSKFIIINKFQCSCWSRYDWGRTIILYDTHSYTPLVGGRGGFLLASTIHDYMIFEGMDVFGREVQSQQNYEDLLRQNVGNNYASESVWGLINSGFIGVFRKSDAHSTFDVFTLGFTHKLN